MTSLSLKPHLLRADTIDLQSHENPSAKDHTRGQYTPAYNNNAAHSTGLHHTQALRNANQDAYQEMQTSPRLGGFNHDTTGPHGQMHMYDEGDEEEDDHPSNGVNGNHDGVYDDGTDSQDEDMDDELLDKISSSPSIEDGKQIWPTRADSLYHEHTPSSSTAPTRGISFSPSSHLLSPPQLNLPKANRRNGQDCLVARGNVSPLKSATSKCVQGLFPSQSPVRSQSSAIPQSSSIDDITRHLLPLDDPFLEKTVDDELNFLDFDDEDPDWEDEETGEESESSDQDTDDFPFTSETRFLDSGWGGECLRELEDIDFEFVYALHTFVATVEGQANATKGDTMVLLDDSNSYWWLVRVVKDGSIGYLPAEHIETPTERLARLNKHRNIDLAAAMLGDNPEKSKNPLKKAIRRRNAKTVNFAPPTYYDADERVWSDEEDENEDGDDPIAAQVENNASQGEQAQRAQQAQQNTQTQQTQQVVQPAETQRVQPVAATIHRVESNDDTDDGEPSSPIKSDASAPAAQQVNSQDAVKRSRGGVVRNTDSFFRDDTVETKKISLTPRLLRNDTDSTVSTENDLKQHSSVDTFDKVVGEDKSKEGKKKEKKGMLSGLFKRKDKSGKGNKSDTDETDRLSEESGRSPQSKEFVEDITSDRKPGKLQKAQPSSTVSPKTSPTEVRGPQRDYAPGMAHQQGQAPAQKNQNEPAQLSQPASYTAPEAQVQAQPQHLQPQQQQPSRFPSLQDKRSVFAPITGALRSRTSSQDMGEGTVKPIYSKRAKERFAIDESDSDEDSTPTAHSSLHRSISPIEYNTLGNGRPDSDMRVSPLETHNENKVHIMRTDRPSEVKERSGLSQQTNSTASPTTPSDQTVSTSKQSPSVATHTPSTSRSTPTWSDASLRSYMDNDQDIRDLLVIIHDKSNVTPVSNEHPLMNGLFASERTKLADMQTQLDSMLLSWLSKKKPSMGSVSGSNSSIAMKA